MSVRKSMYDLSRELSDRIVLEKQYTENLADQLEKTRAELAQAKQCVKMLIRDTKGLLTEGERVDMLELALKINKQ